MGFTLNNNADSYFSNFVEQLAGDAIDGSDEFRMYSYKIKRCPRTRSHDWTECPYAHRGEKAQRRDPRKFHYSAIACAAFRNGHCLKGDACEFAHGVFEYWLHPARYRTRVCNAGLSCQRKVCFFAHTPEQLRPETKYKCHLAYKARMKSIGEGRKMGFETAAEGNNRLNSLKSEDLKWWDEFLASLRRLTVGELGLELEQKRNKFRGAFEAVESELPNIDWISELVM